MIDFVTATPLHGAALALLVLMVILALAKKLVKVALVMVVLLLGYGYYLHTRGEEMLKVLEQLTRQVGAPSFAPAISRSSTHSTATAARPSFRTPQTTCRRF
jgi:hypothetical protein